LTKEIFDIFRKLLRIQQAREIKVVFKSSLFAKDLHVEPLQSLVHIPIVPGLFGIDEPGKAGKLYLEVPAALSQYSLINDVPSLPPLAFVLNRGGVLAHDAWLVGLLVIGRVQRGLSIRLVLFRQFDISSMFFSQRLICVGKATAEIRTFALGWL